jgi:signal transduction histidine kinase
MMQAEDSRQEYVLLGQAFDRFNKAADALGDYYGRLTEVTAGLNRELEDKNRRLCESLAEQERTKQFLTHLLDSLTCGVVVLNPEGEIVLANKAAAGLLGPAVIKPEASPDMTSLRPPEAWNGRSRKSGDREVIITRSPDGRILSSTLTPFPWPGNGEGRSGVIALIEDITEQAMIGAQRERSQTLAAMGEMAAEIAHQVRNPLGGVKLFASMVGREVAGDGNLDQMVEHILSGVKQVDHLITNYLALADPPRPAVSPWDLRALADEALSASAQALDRRGISKAVVYSREPAWAMVDRDLMLQVLLSLILNAVEAMDRGGRLEICIEPTERQLHISIKDTGSGIAPKDLPRIFNPFFTSKKQNLGLGLAVSHLIIDAHHGLIQVESRPGRGTSVTLTLARLALEETAPEWSIDKE